ncbi:MAG TPA: haloacid dehalogenase [Dehalococcoidia bacterium]|nr:haloacid dehalogenase [Dehalococcoidia bacterium]
MSDVSKALDEIMESVRENFASKNAAREEALPLCRASIRFSANAIRAVHRDDFEKARALVAQSGERVGAAKAALARHPDILYAGFVHDAQKEFAEASITLALVSGGTLPSPHDLGVELPAYLNGMGEAVGELRRHLLDTLRTGDVERCEQWLRAMDDMYGVLVTIDYPDAMTGGLRRTTDAVRGILEKTRGDLTLSVQQRRLEERLDKFSDRLG